MACLFLFDLLLKRVEKLGVEKVKDSDLQAVADLFYGGNGCAVISAANNVIEGGLRNAAQRCQLINGNAPCGTQLQYALACCFSDIHGITPQFHLRLIKCFLLLLYRFPCGKLNSKELTMMLVCAKI